MVWGDKKLQTLQTFHKLNSPVAFDKDGKVTDKVADGFNAVIILLN